MNFDKAQWDDSKKHHGGRFAHHTERMEKALRHGSKPVRAGAAIVAASQALYDEYQANGFPGVKAGAQEVLANWDNWMAAIEEGIPA